MSPGTLRGRLALGMGLPLVLLLLGVAATGLRQTKLLMGEGALASASGRIGGVVAAIEGVAIQTHVLALDAAVEAARWVRPLATASVRGDRRRTPLGRR